MQKIEQTVCSSEKPAQPGEMDANKHLLQSKQNEFVAIRNLYSVLLPQDANIVSDRSLILPLFFSREENSTLAAEISTSFSWSVCFSSFHIPKCRHSVCHHSNSAIFAESQSHFHDSFIGLFTFSLPISPHAGSVAFLLAWPLPSESYLVKQFWLHFPVFLLLQMNEVRAVCQYYRHHLHS